MQLGPREALLGVLGIIGAAAGGTAALKQDATAQNTANSSDKAVIDKAAGVAGGTQMTAVKVDEKIK